MKLISFKHRYDYGHDWYVQILHTKRYALLQASVSWNDYASWPYLQIKSGTGSVFSLIFWAYKFGIDFGFLEHTWNWDYMEDNDFKGEDLPYIEQSDFGDQND
jgi:hypothetical protein